MDYRFTWHDKNGAITIDNSKYVETREFDVCSCDTFLSTSILTVSNYQVTWLPGYQVTRLLGN